MKKIFLTLLFMLIAFNVHAKDAELVASNVELTPSGTWVALSSAIDVQQHENLGLFVDLSINAGSSVQFRAVNRTGPSTSLDYPISEPLTTDNELFTQRVAEINLDTNHREFITLKLDGTAPYAVVQANSTVGAQSTGAVINHLFVSKSKGKR